MRSFKRAGFWLTALGLLATSAGVRAAVMTTGVQIVGTGPFDVKYVLAQDVTSLKIDIARAADSVAVKTWDSSVAGTFQAADLLKGPHTLAGFWNGKDNGGLGLPQGDYYARVTTANTTPTTTLTLLSGPTAFAAQPGKTQARNIYGGGANQRTDSPYHNLAYFGVCTSGNTAGSAGVDVVSADASSICWAIGTGSYEFVSAGVLTDDNVVAGGQTNNTLRVINPADGSTVGADLSASVSPRTLAAVGSSTTGQAFYLDGTNGGIKAWDFAGGVPTDVLPDSEFVFNGTGSTPQRGLAVNKAGTTLYACGTALSAGTPALLYPGFIVKYNKLGDGTWAKDGTFTGAIPNYDPTNANINLRGVALSADETTLWVTTNRTGAAINNQVAGLDPVTGASKGAAYTYNFVNGSTITGTPQGICATSGGNLYVSCWNGTATGTTAMYVAILAPPDNGSTDVTRSLTYTFGPPISATVEPYVDTITYHSAAVHWTTDGVATTIVKYGKTAGALDKTISSDPLVTDHTAALEALEANTTYYFQAISASTGRVSYVSPVLNFQTYAFNLSNVAVVDVTENSATFTFNTDDVSNSWVNLGFDGATYPIRYGTDTVTTSAFDPHSLTIRGLKFGSTYHYKVETGWPGAPALYSTDATFKTLDYAQIADESIEAQTTSATLTYVTNIASGATAKYGTDPASLASSIPVAVGNSHVVNFPSLAAGTTYYYTLDLSGGTSVPRTTRVSAFTTQVATSSSTTVTDDSKDKFISGLTTNVTLGAADGLITLDKQSLPGTPVASPNKVPLGTRYQGWAQTNGYLYVIGGYIAGGGTSDKVFYAKINPDGTVGAWTETTALPAPRKVITGQCVGYQGIVYCISGDQTDGNIVPDVYYAKQNADGSLQPWQTTTSIIRERDIAATTIVDGCIVVTGGEPNDSGVYSVRTNYLATLKPGGGIAAWYEITPPTEAIYLNRTMANAHIFYNVGGLNDTDPLNGLRFNATADTSFIQPDSDLTPGYRNTLDPAHTDAWMDAEHYGFGATLAGGKIFSLGGRITVTGAHGEIAHTKIAADGLTTKWVVDAADGTANALPIANYDDEAVTFNGNMYVSPGRLSGNVENDTVQVVPLVPEATGYAYTGTVEGRIIDLGSVQNISHIKVMGTNVTASSVEVRYRFAGASGDFSNWFTAGVDTNITGGARYVQYQLVLKGDGTATPVVSSVTVRAGAAVSTPYDINKDGAIDAKDVQMALRIAAGLLDAHDSSVDFAAGNIVADGVIDALDATAIQRKINGK